MNETFADDWITSGWSRGPDGRWTELGQSATVVMSGTPTPPELTVHNVAGMLNAMEDHANALMSRVSSLEKAHEELLANVSLLRSKMDLAEPDPIRPTSVEGDSEPPAAGRAGSNIQAQQASNGHATQEGLYYIQNRGCAGNSARWWRVDGHGYTSNLDEAWRVSKAEAESICRSRPTEDFPRACSTVDALAERHVDVQQIGGMYV